MKVRVAIAAVAAFACAPAAAHADASFRWDVPERLDDDGRKGAARSVAAAAAKPPTVITLRTCAEDARWTIDGQRVRPTEHGRCAFTLDLEDHAEHQLTLETDGETVSEVVQARHVVVVSLGDSVASGEGNPDRARLVGARWLERRCHRSLRSGAALATLALAAGDPHSSVTFLPLACSGATIPRGLLGPYPGVQPDRRHGDLPAQIAQLAELERQRQVDAVLLSIGANDVYFGPLTIFCAFVNRCPTRRFDPRHPSREDPDPHAPTATDRHARAQRELPARYARVARALADAGIPPERVILVEYFDPTHDDDGETCSRLLSGVSQAETVWARDTVLRALNNAVRSAAERHRWKLVAGVQAAFAEHGICASSGERWIRRVGESLLRGSGLSGPLHPNSAGHLATAALIAPELTSVADVDPGSAVADTAGRPDNEARVTWWWLLVVAAGTSLLTLSVHALIRLWRG